MNAELNSASIYTDISGLNELRSQAKVDPDGSLRKVAEQFEAIFMQMMLKSMRDASFGDPLFDSNQSQFYQSMHDQQLSLHMSKTSGLGLADMLVQQLSQHHGTAQQAAKDIQGYSVSSPFNADKKDASMNPSQQHQIDISQQAATNKEGEISKLSLENNNHVADFKPFAGPVDFIKRTWHMAKQAADELGTQPEVLVAQAALETGWGKAIQKRRDGSSSYNLFNIKADSRWQDDTITVNTLEYRDGYARKERADFRAYPSLQASFSDYVEFIKSSPRYHSALQKAADPQAYIEELHKAGYATDPEYSNKIKDILERSSFGEVAGDIKVSQNETLS
jgi:flagellar protein FlgJ